MKKFLSRKFIMSNLVMLIIIILFIFNKIPAELFVALLTANGGIYNISNSLSTSKE